MAEALLFKEEPLMNIRWLNTSWLQANDYNPNRVMVPELDLLKKSILLNGWIQPIIVNEEPIDVEIPQEAVNVRHPMFDIIDGFHRYYLSENDKQLKEKYQGKVPCIVFNLPAPDRMLLTVRINRAKGVHMAVKMHELITIVFQESGYSKAEIASQIGADLKEIDLLLQENVFTKLDIGNHKYSQAWVPQKK